MVVMNKKSIPHSIYKVGGASAGEREIMPAARRYRRRNTRRANEAYASFPVPQINATKKKSLVSKDGRPGEEGEAISCGAALCTYLLAHQVLKDCSLHSLICLVTFFVGFRKTTGGGGGGDTIVEKQSC